MTNRQDQLFSYLFHPFQNRYETIASTTKIITNHFAISIVKPATPLAPNINATNANTRNKTASPIKSGIFYSSSDI
jgi:hypothetical protein